MASDKYLVERRSADELRFLKDHVAKLRSDPKIAALADAHDQAEPRFTLEAFQSGVLISGYACRLTIGTLALLRATASRCLGYGEDTSPLTDRDIVQAVFLMADEKRNEAVSVADDGAELAVSVRRFGRSLNVALAAYELLEFLRRTGAALRENVVVVADGDEEEEEILNVFHAPDDSWSDDLDLLAHEYHWRDDRILWEIPLVLVARQRESIAARRSGQPRTASRADTGIRLLEALKEKGDELMREEAS